MNPKSKIQNRKSPADCQRLEQQKKTLSVAGREFRRSLQSVRGPGRASACLDREGQTRSSKRSARNPAALFTPGFLATSHSRPSQSAGADPSGRKYYVPLTGWLSR